MNNAPKVFFSYHRSNAVSVNALTKALQAEGLDVWIDQNEIADSASIQARIEHGLATANVLLAWYSVPYAASRPCQWELTAALLAGHADDGPTPRVLIINPEPDDQHIQPLYARNLRRFAVPTQLTEFADLAKRIAAAVRPVKATMGSIRRLTPPPCHGIKPLGSNRFVGRFEVLWHIHNALAIADYAIVAGQPSPQSLGQLVQIQGGGGLGKSLLAEEYALRFAAFWPGGIFWLRALGHNHPGHSNQPDEKPHALQQRRAQAYSSQLAAFVDALDIDPRGRNDAQLRSILAQKLDEGGQRYLWIVDDLVADNRAELEQWLAPSARGQTLITTRSRRQDGIGVVIPLERLSPRDARRLLTGDETLRPEREPDVASILHHLDGHALALDVAREVCRHGGYANFRQSLESPSRDALQLAAELAPELPNGHNPSVAATLLAGFAPLRNEAKDFLRLAAQLAAAPIERELVVGSFIAADTDDQATAEHRADLGMQQCHQHSLADRVAGTTALNVHTLISRSLRFHDRELAQLSRWKACAIVALNQIMAKAGDIRHHATLSSFVIHANQLAAGATDEPGLALASRVGRYEYEAGRYANACDWWQTRYAGQIALYGKEHPIVLAAQHDLASSLKALGRLSEACALQEAVLEVSRRTLGMDHLETLTTMSTLAGSLEELGREGEAAALLQEVLAQRQQRLGDTDPATLTAMNNLARVLMTIGKRQEARELLTTVLAERTQQLGHDHAATFAAMSNLASAFRLEGNLNAALPLEEAALAGRIQILGEKHPNTFTSMSNLALLLFEMNDYAAARKLQESVVAGMRHTLGAGHLDTLVAMTNLASTLKTLGEFDAARELQLAVLDERQRQLGNHHPKTIGIAWNLFETECQRKDHPAILELLNRYLLPLMPLEFARLNADLKYIRQQMHNMMPLIELVLAGQNTQEAA